MDDPAPDRDAENRELRSLSTARDMVPPCQLCGIEIDAKGVRRTTSTALLGTKTELHILHNGETYRLTLTRFGKLMLQK